MGILWNGTRVFLIHAWFATLAKAWGLHSSPFGKRWGNFFFFFKLDKSKSKLLEYVVECVCGKCDKHKTLETRIKLCRTKMVWNQLLIVFCIIRFPMGFHKGSKEFQNMAFLCVFFHNFEDWLQKCDISHDSWWSSDEVYPSSLTFHSSLVNHERCPFMNTHFSWGCSNIHNKLFSCLLKH